MTIDEKERGNLAFAVVATVNFTVSVDTATATLTPFLLSLSFGIYAMVIELAQDSVDGTMFVHD